MNVVEVFLPFNCCLVCSDGTFSGKEGSSVWSIKGLSSLSVFKGDGAFKTKQVT
ncbi:MAG: hypothetical protein ACRCVL_04815 [Cetobacterium sp.]